MTRRTLPKGHLSKLNAQGDQIEAHEHELEMQSLNNRLELQKNLINAMSEEMAKLRVRIEEVERVNQYMSQIANDITK
jgi:hypothetical protein